MGGRVLDFTRLMLISTKVEVVVEVGVELGKNSGHYVIASSRPPEHRLLERRMLEPKLETKIYKNHCFCRQKKR